MGHFDLANYLGNAKDCKMSRNLGLKCMRAVHGGNCYHNASNIAVLATHYERLMAAMTFDLYDSRVSRRVELAY